MQLAQDTSSKSLEHGLASFKLCILAAFIGVSLFLTLPWKKHLLTPALVKSNQDRCASVTIRQIKLRIHHFLLSCLAGHFGWRRHLWEIAAFSRSALLCLSVCVCVCVCAVIAPTRKGGTEVTQGNRRLMLLLLFRSEWLFVARCINANTKRVIIIRIFSSSWIFLKNCSLFFIRSSVEQICSF